jgi:hypothetical protein
MMMRARYIVILLLTFLSVPASAQMVRVTGVVRSRDDTTGIPGATIRFSGAPDVQTDRQGRFLTVMRRGRYSLSVQALGYRSFDHELYIRRDTSLTILLTEAPITLPSVSGTPGEINAQLRFIDRVTGLELMQAQATRLPDGSLQGAVSGSLTLRGLTAGDTVTVAAEAAEHLPIAIQFVPMRDTVIDIPMEVDSVALRMIDAQVKRLDNRANAVPYARHTLDRDGIARWRLPTLWGLIRSQLSPKLFEPDPPFPPAVEMCLVLDEVPVDWYVLSSTPPELVERLEIYGSDGRMIRAYTKRYVASLMGKEIPRIGYAQNGIHRFCN